MCVRLLAVLLLAACRKDAPAPAPVRVAAASDLTLAFEELARQLGQPVTFTFGASGQLARQLAAGAPFDVFAAANLGFVDQAVAAGACDGATARPYARGELAVWSRSGPVKLEALGEPRFQKVAIANPDTAPYGQAAKEALVSAGLWETVQPRLVFGENVRQTLQLAETGNVEVALVSHALLVGRPDGAFTLVDQTRHRPLIQALAVCRGGQNRAGGEAFVRLLESEAGRAVMQRYGFEPPQRTADAH